MMRRGLALAAVTLAIAHAAAGGEASLDLRYRFRPGQTWTERYERTVERLSQDRREVVVDESSTAEVTVVSVDARGRALLRRVELDAEGAPAGEPFSYHMTSSGEYELPEGAAGQAEFALINRFAPVVQSKGERALTLVLPGGGTVTESEAFRIVSQPGELDCIRLRLERRAAAQQGIMRETLTMPGGYKSAPVPRRVDARVDLAGSAGSGEMIFDAVAGRLVSYRMTSTTGLELHTDDRPEPVVRSFIVRVSIEWRD